MVYEELITGTPAGIEYQVEFGEGHYYQADGYDPDCVDALEDRSDPDCIEKVKGPGMEWMIKGDGGIRNNTNLQEQLPAQLMRLIAAGEVNDATPSLTVLARN